MSQPNDYCSLRPSVTTPFHSSQIYDVYNNNNNNSIHNNKSMNSLLLPNCQTSSTQQSIKEEWNDTTRKINKTSRRRTTILSFLFSTQLHLVVTLSFNIYCLFNLILTNPCTFHSNLDLNSIIPFYINNNHNNKHNNHINNNHSYNHNYNHNNHNHHLYSLHLFSPSFFVYCQDMIDEDSATLLKSQCKSHQSSINDFYTCVSMGDCLLSTQTYPMKCTTISELPKIFTEPLPHTLLLNRKDTNEENIQKDSSEQQQPQKCKYDSDCMIVYHEKFRWNCCYEQYCEALQSIGMYKESTTTSHDPNMNGNSKGSLSYNIPYNPNDFSSVNKEWYSSKQFEICKHAIYSCDGKNSIYTMDRNKNVASSSNSANSNSRSNSNSNSNNRDSSNPSLSSSHSTILSRNKQCYQTYLNLFGSHSIFIYGENIKLKPYCNTLKHECAFYNTISTNVATGMYNNLFHMIYSMKSLLLVMVMTLTLLIASFLILKSEWIGLNLWWCCYHQGRNEEEIQNLSMKDYKYTQLKVKVLFFE
ncbi:hypothetical protein C9374_009887 [Naegleria lovaniensis]|uniref:Uncharacterized protein n=1 Tax=Naegleria lovaniensis TaxID=51637 RepID=A0AA88GHA4_NAELO|nr:uncharacterized protein C9374_009887 [Naegleria lovaniensis]KAG2375264.1 hypothetical protein C9374_009887 [Naegleria lovaniensis]